MMGYIGLLSYVLVIITTLFSSKAQSSTDPSSSNGGSSGESDTSNNGNSHSKRTIILALVYIAVFATVLLLIVYCRRYRRHLWSKPVSKKEHHDEEAVTKKDETRQRTDGAAIEVRVGEDDGDDEKARLRFMKADEVGFELSDLLKASAEGMGKGNFGNCYKAMVDNGRPRVVVVKRLRNLKPVSSQEFRKELKLISVQNHPNLLPPMAYCYTKDEKLLVYKFATHGNLYNRIHGGRGTKGRIPFRWSSRLFVARCVARALEFLHLNPNSEPNLIHGNLKSTNVLLDGDEKVLISDYGLTSLIAQPIMVHRMVSYKSPEYHLYKRVSSKSDVWSYGCLVLELLTGRVPAHSAPSGTNGVDLPNWVHRAVREEWTAEIFDMELLNKSANASGMLKLLQLAIRCCDKSPEKWPHMTEVVAEVESIKLVDSSEDDDDLSLSIGPSFTDESMSATSSMVISVDDRR